MLFERPTSAVDQSLKSVFNVFRRKPSLGAPDDIRNSATWKKVLLRNLHLNGHIVIFHDMHRFKS